LQPFARAREREREREDPARRRIPPPLGGEDMLLSKNQDNGGISAGEQRAKCYASRTVIPHPVISALHYVRLIKSDPPPPPPLPLQLIGAHPYVRRCARNEIDRRDKLAAAVRIMALRISVKVSEFIVDSEKNRSDDRTDDHSLSGHARISCWGMHGRAFASIRDDDPV